MKVSPRPENILSMSIDKIGNNYDFNLIQLLAHGVPDRDMRH